LEAISGLAEIIGRDNVASLNFHGSARDNVLFPSIPNRGRAYCQWRYSSGEHNDGVDEVS